jgi:hypothetical protein
VDFVARKTARVHGYLFPLSWLSFELPQGIEAFEFEATIIAEQLMHPCHLKN